MTTRSSWLAVAAACAVLLAGAGPADAAEQYHLVFVLTDDQRFDTLWAMPIVQSELMARGVTFTRAMVTTPICCPTRASLMAGGFLAQNTGVLGNDPPSGGIGRFVDEDTLALRLQRAGYRTQMVGKYLNHWEEHPHVPRGWTEFAGVHNSFFTVGSTGEEPGTGVSVPFTGLQTDAERDRVLQFIDRELPSGHPLFIYLAVSPPHYPAVPAPQDENLFPGYVHRGRGWICCYWVTQWFSSLAEQDEFHRDQLRSLQAVDRAVGAIVDRFEAAGQLDRTVFVFSSDNGYLWGEHGKFGKSSIWDEALRVPLVVVVPGVSPRTEDHLVAMNLDVPATFFDYAGLEPPGDGASLRRLLQDPHAAWRTEALFEFFDTNFAGLRTREESGQEWKYAEVLSTPTVRRYLFDLTNDPYELQNLVTDPAHQARAADFASRLQPKKGISSNFSKSGWTGSFGQPFSLSLGVWGGMPPFTWRITAGALPVGLSLDSSGTISGVPLEVTTNKLVEFELTGSRFLSQPRRFESFLDRLLFTMAAGDVDGDGVADGVDNCPFRANAGQADSDGDGVGDACFACSDGVDNDEDGRVDFDGAASVLGGTQTTEADPGCFDPEADDPALGTSEQSAFLPCDDGIDNDADGFIDLADPGCLSPSWTTESPHCNDGIDNDDDGGIDHDGTPPDPECVGKPWRARETPGGCGDVSLVAAVVGIVLLWPIWRLRSRAARRWRSLAKSVRDEPERPLD